MRICYNEYFINKEFDNFKNLESIVKVKNNINNFKKSRLF